MMKKRVYFLLVALLLLGTTACGSEADSTEEATTQKQTKVTTEEATEEVTTEVETTEVPTTEVVATEAETTEVITEETTTEVTTTEETTETVESAGAITPEEALELIEKSFDTEDEETGNTYAFTHVNTMTVNGEEYHVFMWSWLVDGHSSYLGDLFVKTDGSAIYQGIFVGDGATVYTDTNYLK